MELKTVQTHHVPVRYFEGGSGPDLVYPHGAGGVTEQRPAPQRAGGKAPPSMRL